MSWPNQYCADGQRSRLIGDRACGSTVFRYGANTAIAVMISSKTPPTMIVGWRRTYRQTRCRHAVVRAGRAISLWRTAISRSISDARVNQRVAEFDQQVDQHRGGREDQDDPLDDRIIAPQDRVDGQPAEPGDREHRLGDD